MVELAAYRRMLEERGFTIESLDEVAARTFPGYYRSQRRAARRRELIAARGRVGATVGNALNYAAHRVFASGLLDYVLVGAVKNAST
jgi:hypothetical protein